MISKTHHGAGFSDPASFLSSSIQGGPERAAPHYILNARAPDTPRDRETTAKSILIVVTYSNAAQVSRKEQDVGAGVGELLL